MPYIKEEFIFLSDLSDISGLSGLLGLSALSGLLDLLILILSIARARALIVVFRLSTLRAKAKAFKRLDILFLKTFLPLLT